MRLFNYYFLLTVWVCLCRDLKLENLLLQSNKDDAAVKVADFGFAKAVDSVDGNTLLTQCGSPLYVAPEIISKAPYGKPVDMWAIGIITFILLGGYPPFQDEGKQAVLFAKIKTGNFEFEPEFWDHVSEPAKHLISGLLVVDPKHRMTVEDALSHPWVKLHHCQLLITSPLYQTFDIIYLFVSVLCRSRVHQQI